MIIPILMYKTSDEQMFSNYEEALSHEVKQSEKLDLKDLALDAMSYYFLNNIKTQNEEGLEENAWFVQNFAYAKQDSLDEFFVYLERELTEGHYVQSPEFEDKFKKFFDYARFYFYVPETYHNVRSMFLDTFKNAINKIERIKNI